MIAQKTIDAIIEEYRQDLRDAAIDAIAKKPESFLLITLAHSFDRCPISCVIDADEYGVTNLEQYIELLESEVERAKSYRNMQ
jgi:hypothetical protein